MYALQHTQPKNRPTQKLVPTVDLPLVIGGDKVTVIRNLVRMHNV